MKLNLGSGTSPIEGYINIDRATVVKPDLLLDVAKEPLPYGNDTVDEIVAYDFFEHIFDVIPVFNECHRVLKPDGILNIETPMAGTNEFYKDPTHVRGFVPETFKYFSDYAESYPAMGALPWAIEAIRNTDERIFVTLKPKK